MNRPFSGAVLRWLAVASLLGAPPAHPRQDLEGRFEDEIEVTEVLLDVLVTDKRGQVIIGLGADDFEVFEEGVRAEISGVTFYSSRELMGSQRPLESHGLRVDETADERYFIVFFQQQRRAATEVPGLLGRQMEAARDLADWIADRLAPRDRVAVAVFETRLEIVQDFTNNTQDLQRAIQKAMRGHGEDENWPSRRGDPADRPSLLQSLPEGRRLGKATEDIYQALQVLARAAGSVRGRVNLLFIGRGVGEMNDFGVWEPDSRFYGPTVEILNDNNIAVYPLSVMPLGTRHTLEQSLHSLAHDTGGVYHRQFTSFTRPLEMIAEENGGYYLLSYESRRPQGESGFQRVRIRVRNPELRVRARRGYLYGRRSPRDPRR